MQLDLKRLFEGDEQILPFVFALDFGFNKLLSLIMEVAPIT